MDKQSKPRIQNRNYTNYFRYQMKDTNQLLKDFISFNMISDCLSLEPAKNQIGNKLFKIEELSVSNQFQHENTKNQKKQIENSQQVRKKAVKSEDDLQNEQNSNQKCLIEDSSFSLQRKNKRQNSMEDLILQKFHLSSSQIQDQDDPFRASIQKYKFKDFVDHTLDRYEDSYKQIKKQRKGLANISQRVKSIVSQHKKLTYRQVSDYVLQYSQEEINLLDPIQRTKQVKNIKRRVYDALNVLVAVGILGKHQRCVCKTEWTEIPGKKHSSQWNKINSKIQYLNKLKRNCNQKQQALNYHIEKYHAIAALRNKHTQEHDRQIALQDRFKSTSPNNQTKKDKQQDLKLVFPVIVFFPGSGEDQNEKLTVELEQEDENQNKNGKEVSVRKSKIKVSGKNMIMMGDFDCALQMELKRYRKTEQEDKIIKQIEEYAKESGGKRVPQYKFEVDDSGQGSIEEYFNEQMFQSK